MEKEKVENGFNRQLSMELVPVQAHGRNLRKILSKSMWSTISLRVRESSPHAHKCLYCNNPSEHCHEQWEWVVKDGMLIQQLVDLQPVCADCHDFMHFGRLIATKQIARADFVSTRACNINGWDADHMMAYIGNCTVAHVALSELPLGDMDLSWVQSKESEWVGWTLNELCALSNYLSDEPHSVCAEHHKEDHVGEPE